METSDKSDSVQIIFQKQNVLRTKIEDIIKIIGLKNPEAYRSKQQSFGPLPGFMEPVLEEGTSVWGLPIPENHWDVLPENIVAIADRTDNVSIGKIADEGQYFLLTNPAGDLSEKINKCEIASICVIEKPNADDPFEVEAVKDYLISNPIGASKDSLFELITFAAGRLYYDEKHPYKAVARVKAEITGLIDDVRNTPNISQIELERCLLSTELYLTYTPRVSQIASVQEDSRPDLVELKSFIEKKLASIISHAEEPKIDEDQQSGGQPTEDKPLTARQTVLLAIFQDAPPFTAKSHGQYLYQKYTKFLKNTNWTGYASESWISARKLIDDYKRILPLLNKSQRQRAESEIVIIEAGRK